MSVGVDNSIAAREVKPRQRYYFFEANLSLEAGAYLPVGRTVSKE